MNTLFRQYFRRRKNRRNRRNYISWYIKISWFLYMLRYFIFYPRANDTFETPFGGWLGSTWSISAGRESLKSCFGVKLCLMLVENAVLCQRNYDGFLCYFFYLIITISFQINIVLLIFSVELTRLRKRWMGWTKIVSKLECLKNTI